MTRQRQSYRQGWDLYPWSMAGHHVQGALSSAGIFSGNEDLANSGLAWCFMYVAYQGLSVIRKKDSAGLDVLDFMVGFGIVVACSFGIGLFS